MSNDLVVEFWPPRVVAAYDPLAHHSWWCPVPEHITREQVYRLVEDAVSSGDEDKRIFAFRVLESKYNPLLVGVVWHEDR